MEYLNSLKNLYGLSEIQLDDLNQIVKNNIYPNNVSSISDKIDILMSNQSSIKNKIPTNKFNVVSNFLIEVYSYINTFKKNTIKVNTQVNKVQDLSNYHMDSSILNNHQKNSYNGDRLNIPKMNSVKEKQNILGDIDPYELYGIPKNQKIDLQDLKLKYKKYALETHPDKNNGDSKNFNIISEAFKVLYEDYKLKQNDKQFNELKNNSKSFIEKQHKTNYRNTDFSKDNFNANKFNKFYDEHRISNVTDDGYGDWENSNENEDIVKNPNLTKGNFNSMFDTNVKVSNNLVKYTSPKELFMNDDNNCEELGVDKIDNYTGKSKSINYTDYKEAHTTSRLVDPNAKYTQYNSINEIKAARSNIKDLTADEIMEIELEKTRKEEQEERRQLTLMTHDAKHFENYDKIHNIMLSRN